MEITSEELRKKIQQLFPDRSYNLTSEILDELCSDSTSRDFLLWFSSELSPDNVLTEEEIKLEGQIKKSGKWLKDDELDECLAEATAENPDLLQILESDVNKDDLSANFSSIKIAHNFDENYLHSLEMGTKNFKNIENKLDERIEREQDELAKLKFGEKLAFEECLEIMEKYESIQRRLSEQVEQLVTIYSDASQKKCAPSLWTQLPLDLFIKHMETYSEYLKLYIKKEFGTDEVNEDERTSSINTEPDINLDYSDEKQNLEKKILELKTIQQRLNKSKLSQILAKGRKEATQAMIDCAQKIYNHGNVLMPKTLALLKAEIMELKVKRDNLEKQVTILREHQIPESVDKFVSSMLNKILVENAKATDERREFSIKKLKNLLSLVRNRGHMHSDLLYILVELENQKLTQIEEFVTDVRNYLEMEYSSCTKRYIWMVKAKNQLNSSSFENDNFFIKYFTAMMEIEENQNSLGMAIEKFSQILEENEKLSENICESMNNNVNSLQLFDRNMIENYNREIQNSGGFSLEVENQIVRMEKNLCGVQTEVMIVRNKLKEMMEKINGLEREKTILWQKFLAEPEELKRRYEQLMEMSNQVR
ncbi:augmin complex subunit dgt3 [Leptopilina heterotoma]|uniref:augmin complex subunit dgt3 n=1 Tax=Leptopilina heterotoma TaxID=63436 RepID=UPI001CA80B88|nr:augmin complex subunit dgt3 [Leptopilina heterotoma]